MIPLESDIREVYPLEATGVHRALLGPLPRRRDLAKATTEAYRPGIPLESTRAATAGIVALAPGAARGGRGGTHDESLPHVASYDVVYRVDVLLVGRVVKDERRLVEVVYADATSERRRR